MDGVAHIDVSGIDYFLSDGTQLLNGVTFKVPDGTKTALIGPNGAGKTTLLSILAGIREPDSGELTVPGEIGWVPQLAGLYRRLTVAENLRLFAHL